MSDTYGMTKVATFTLPIVVLDFGDGEFGYEIGVNGSLKFDSGFRSFDEAEGAARQAAAVLEREMLAAYTEARSAIADKPTITIPGMVMRREDMSPKGRLLLILQEDGDVVVEVSGREEHGERERATVEFCHGAGGQSPRTVEALKLLMAAMQADNDAGRGSRDYERKCHFNLREQDRDYSK